MDVVRNALSIPIVLQIEHVLAENVLILVQEFVPLTRFAKLLIICPHVIASLVLLEIRLAVVFIWKKVRFKFFLIRFRFFHSNTHTLINLHTQIYKHYVCLC